MYRLTVTIDRKTRVAHFGTLLEALRAMTDLQGDCPDLVCRERVGPDRFELTVRQGETLLTARLEPTSGW